MNSSFQIMILTGVLAIFAISSTSSFADAKHFTKAARYFSVVSEYFTVSIPTPPVF